MSNRTPSVILHFDGQLTIEGDRPHYDGGRRKVISMTLQTTLDDLKGRIYRAIRTNPQIIELKLTCEFPVLSGFVAVPIEDDDDCKSMLIECRENGSLRLYVEKFPLSNTPCMADPSISQNSNVCMDTPVEVVSCAPKPALDRIVITNEDVQCTPTSPLGFGSSAFQSCIPQSGLYQGCISDYCTQRADSVHPENDDCNGSDNDASNCVPHAKCNSDIGSGSNNDNRMQRMNVENIIQHPTLGVTSWVDTDEVTFDKSVMDRALQDPPELYLGMVYPTKWELQAAINAWCIVKHVQYKVDNSDKERMLLSCVKSDCKWKLRAISSKRSNNRWKITKISGAHTCERPIADNRHRQSTSKFICNFILPMMRESLDLTPKRIQEVVFDRFHIRISYMKAWDARKKAIEKLLGGWDESKNFCMENAAANASEVQHDLHVTVSANMKTPAAGQEDDHA